MPNTISLGIENLSMHIDKKSILNKISLDIEAGACVGVIGPNGSGKTSLLKAILGFLSLSSGKVSLSGQDLARLSAAERSQTIAYVAQDATGALPFTVKAFLQLAYFPWQDFMEQSAWEEYFQSLCAEFKLLDKLHRRLGTLSGGERQRVMLVQSLLQRPKLLLLDEITNHLDIFYQLETLEFLRSQPMTKIMVLHDINLAARFCDRLIMLKSGECLALGPTSDVLTEESIQDLFGVPCEIMRKSGRIRHIVLGLAD